jgi:hypothetical protein
MAVAISGLALLACLCRLFVQHGHCMPVLGMCGLIGLNRTVGGCERWTCIQQAFLCFANPSLQLRCARSLPVLHLWCFQAPLCPPGLVLHRSHVCMCLTASWPQGHSHHSDSALQGCLQFAGCVCQKLAGMCALLVCLCTLVQCTGLCWCVCLAGVCVHLCSVQASAGVCALLVCVYTCAVYRPLLVCVYTRAVYRPLLASVRQAVRPPFPALGIHCAVPLGVFAPSITVSQRGSVVCCGQFLDSLGLFGLQADTQGIEPQGVPGPATALAAAVWAPARPAVHA